MGADKERKGTVMKSWYLKCKEFASANDSLESFARCVERVVAMHEQAGGRETPIGWQMPICGKEPNELWFSTVRIHGGIVFRQDKNLWGIHT